MVVLDGAPSLRTPEGWRELAQGEVVPFLRGERGAHQLVNRTDETVRFLAFSTNGEPDIVIRPDSNTLGAYERQVDDEVRGRCRPAPYAGGTRRSHAASPGQFARP